MTPHKQAKELDALEASREMIRGLTDELETIHRDAYERAKEHARKPQETADVLAQHSKMIRGLTDELKALFPIIKKSAEK